MRCAVFLFLFALACSAQPEAGPDARAGADAFSVDRDAQADLPDTGGAGCDCCGTLVATADGGTCLGGICDPWCGLVDPCGGTCDRATSVCVHTPGGADVGTSADAGAGGTTRCVLRPSACTVLANCGGPAPDPSCNASDPCFAALACVPARAVRRGANVECRGA